MLSTILFTHIFGRIILPWIIPSSSFSSSTHIQSHPDTILNFPISLSHFRPSTSILHPLLSPLNILFTLSHKLSFTAAGSTGMMMLSFRVPFLIHPSSCPPSLLCPFTSLFYFLPHSFFALISMLISSAPTSYLLLRVRAVFSSQFILTFHLLYASLSP